MTKTDIDYSAIQDEVNKITCPEHNKQPEVIVDKDAIKFTYCCCSPFEDSIRSKVKELMQEQTRGILLGAAKKLFRK